MTKEEAIKVLSESIHDGSIVPWDKIVEAAHLSIEALSQPPLPSNLNEAANKFAVSYDQGTCDGIAQECFKSGAEWMARQMKQEQPEVDLEKFTEKMDAWKARYNHPDNIPIKATMAFTARMFYMYPKVAREWYDNLRKVTLD